MKNFHTLFYFCILAITLLACRKEGDSVAPRISVSEPLRGNVYNVYDTLWIRASVSDESKLVSVKITILDASQKPVLRTLYYEPVAATFDVNSSLLLDDIHLTGGKYTLQVNAYDGTNYSNAFVEIQINEVPVELKYPVLVSLNGIYGINISIADAGSGWRKVISLEGDYYASSVSSYDQQVYTAGRVSGNLNACLLPAGPMVWQVPLLSAPPYRYFEDVRFSWPLLYVATYDGKIFGYDRFGMVKYSSIIEPGYIPERIGKNEDFIFAGLRQKTGNFRKIGVYYPVSGSLMQSLEVPLDVVSFRTIDKDNLLVFGNIGNAGTIMIYSIRLNNLRQLHTFSDGKIGAVTQSNTINYFISGAHAIHRFIYTTNTLVEFISDAPGALIDFDVVNDRLYALFNHRLAAFDFPYATPVFGIPVADSALAFHLVYNK